MTNVTDVEKALITLITEELSNFPDLVEIAQRWSINDLIKVDLAATYNDWLKDTENMDDEPLSLESHITYYLEHPYLLGDNSTLIGLKEFAEIIRWDKARLSTKYSRQRAGKRVRPLLPKPIQILAATPVWTKAQAIKYKETLELKSSE